ncbi:MAG: Ig-like domain-containing protein [Clostridia bacterium]|nr:Ig-like domain-containing protein [Clostridia bacterium]
MRTVKKLLALVLSVLTLVSVCAFSASAADAPELSLTIVSQTNNEVVVKLTLEKGEFNSMNATFITSSAIGKCTEITINKDGVDMSAPNADKNKFAVASAEIPLKATRTVCTAKFTKTSSAAIKNSDITLDVGACAIAVMNQYGMLTNKDITKSVKVNVNYASFALNNNSYAVNYKDSFTVDFTSNYPAEALTWTSSNEKVAKVDANGNVYASGTGNATITVKSNDGVVNESVEVKVSYTVLQWIIVIVLFGWIWY